MNPALQFLELVDKNAIQMFNEFIEKYSAPKVKKEKKVKEPKPIKEPKPVKIKEPKEPKPTKTKEKKAKEPKPGKEEKQSKTKEKSALDILIEIKNEGSGVNSTPKPSPKNYVLEIKKFIDEINEFMELNAKNNTWEEIFLDFDNFNKNIKKQKNKIKTKEKHFDI